MQKNEIRLNYQQATQFVQVGRYEEALEILIEINEIKPNTENVLYLMAMCHAKVGHKSEALDLCDRLVKEFDHVHAKEIQKQLNASSSPVGSARRTREVSPKKKAKPDETSTAEQEQEDVAPIVSSDAPPAESEVVSEEASGNEDAFDEEIESDLEDNDSSKEETAVIHEKQTEQPETPSEVAEQQQTPTVPADAESEETISRMHRPLWLGLLWVAILAMVVACLLYIYVLDPILNPF